MRNLIGELERPRKESSTCERELGTRLEREGPDGLFTTLPYNPLVEVTVAPEPKRRTRRGRVAPKS